MIRLLVILSIVIILYLLPVKITIDYKRQRKKDDLNIKLGILFINYKLNISYLNLKKILALPTFQVRAEIKGILSKNIEVTDKVDQRKLHKICDFFQQVYRISKRFKTFLILTHNCRFFLWKTSFGLRNPAYTGLATGALWGIKSSIIAIIQNYLDFKSLPIIEVEPNFNYPETFKVEFKGIFEFRLGNIILIGLKIILYEIKRRVKSKWLTIQLKH